MQSGVLRCRTCGKGYDVIDGIPYLVQFEIEEEDLRAAKQREARARDSDAPVYDSTVSDYQTQIEIAALLRALRVKKSDVAIDAGAGTGRLTLEMAKLGSTVLALDLSPRSLAINRDKCASKPGFDVHFIVADACYLPLRDGIANKVGSGMMIEHIPTHHARKQALLEINRVLRPGGRLVLTAYNFSWGKRRRSKREGFHGKDLYYYYFKRNEFRQLLNKYDVRTVTALLNLPSRLRSRVLDRVIQAVPPLAGLTGDLLFGVAERKSSR